MAVCLTVRAHLLNDFPVSGDIAGQDAFVPGSDDKSADVQKFQHLICQKQICRISDFSNSYK
ncbi:MAG: hypothetical protein B6245_16300 [Desulfobacteraceae bacterium 4572_88]|nr:MAG: hypothetical protein B6245_16300 [Desulfobacteraceae bacterium 4572_88]